MNNNIRTAEPFKSSRPACENSAGNISEDFAAGFGNEDVVFYSDAPEIPVFLDGVVVDELCESPLRFPTINQLRDEIDSWFHRDDESRLDGFS